MMQFSRPNRTGVLRQRLHGFAAVGLLFALVASVVVVGATTATAAESGTVSGTVFRDFNGNGEFDAGNAAAGVAADRGLAEVHVTVTDGFGNSWNSTTAHDGEYTVDVTNAETDALRVEFTGLPDGYVSAPHGSDNGTSVQFVSLQNNSDVSFAAHVPEEFGPTNPPVVTGIQYAGLRELGNSDEAAVVATPWNVEGNYSANSHNDADNPNDTNVNKFNDRTDLATYKEVGSVWAGAFSRSRNELFVGASYKRMSELGPLGLGGIYRFADALDGDEINDLVDVQDWLRLEDLQDQDGSDISVGEVPTGAERELGEPSKALRDPDAFEQAAKVGIGGMTVSTDGQTLFVVNLFDRNLYAIDLATVETTNRATRIDLGLGEGQRPWAVSVHRGQVHIGYVDTGEVNDPNEAGQAAAALNLRAYVVRAPEDSVLAGGTFDGEHVLYDQGEVGASLGYAKGSPMRGWGGTDDWGTQYPQIVRWNSWTDQWSWNDNDPTTYDAVGISRASTPQGWGNNTHVYPQAILSDLAFDADGFLNLGFADRTAIQAANNNLAAHGGGSAHFETLSSGDLLVAGRTAAGTYVLERNGQVNAVREDGVSINRGPSDTSNNGEGPGSGEFYNDRHGNFTNGQGTGANHHEIALGSLVSFSGVDEVLSTAYDPIAGIRVAGLGWFSHEGDPTRGYEHTRDTGNPAAGEGSSTFQKGGGLGGIEVLAQQAPVEIGNRVWFDADQDGIQDADEPAVPGVTVLLLDEDDNVVATTITDEHGEYYFRSDEIEGFDPYGEYTIEFVLPDDGNLFTNDSVFGTVPWSEVRFTSLDGGTNDAIDSDVDPETGRIEYSVGGPGENDHTLDAGLIANATFQVRKEISNDGGDAADGATFVIDVAAEDFRDNDIDLGDDSQLTLAPDETSASVVVPVGTWVTVTEDDENDDGVVAYVVDPAGAFLVTGTSDEPQLVTVTNTLASPGTFTITKSVSGEAADLVDGDTEFDFEYSTNPTDDASWLTLSGFATADGDTIVTSPELPYGTEVTIRELDRPLIPGVEWQTPSWTVDGGTAVMGETVAVTIGDDEDVAITVDNPTTLATSGFAVTKDVSGGAAGSVPSDFEFTVEYKYVDTNSLDVEDELTLTKASPTDSVTGLPYGTLVSLREVPPTGAPEDVQWLEPVWTVDDAVLTPDTEGWVEIEIGAGTLEVLLQNPTEQLTGGFEVAKEVTGPAAGSVPDDFEFTVNYSYGTEPTTGSFTVGKDSRSDQLTGIPAGTVVTLSEAARTGAPADVSWQTPLWSGEGVTDNEDGTATVTIQAGSTITVELENPTEQFTNGFQIAKQVTGDAAGSVPSDFEFVVNYELDGVEQQPITLTPADSSETFSGLPLGTVVTLSEQTPGAAAPDVQWGEGLFSVDGGNPEATATFTIGDDNVEVVLVNPTTQLVGDLEVTKQVTGPAAHLADPEQEFSVTWSALSDSETVTLTNGETWTLPELPAGTVVTLSEAQPIDGLPALTGWEAPVWSGTGFTVDDDGNAVVVIGAGATIELGLENPTWATPLVEIEKGDGADGVIINDADTMADGQLYANGETRTVVFRVQNTGAEDLVDVVLTDNTLSGAVVDSLSWTLPDGSVLDATLSGTTWIAQWEETFSGDAVWEPGDIITGTATLTLEGGEPHLNYGEVQARGAASGTPVGDADPYYAYSAGIQVIKYDGELDDPQVRDGDTWVIPAKPLTNADQDANSEDTAVRYVTGEANTVRWVVTNTGSTWLTSVDLADVTDAGPDVSSWTADLSAFGGPADYDFVTEGTWSGLIPPGASFFAQGTLTLGANANHANTVTVAATPVVPETNDDGMPTGDPQLDDDGNPVVVTDQDGSPVRLTDSDPFHAFTRGSSDVSGDDQALSSTGVGIAVAGMLLAAIAAMGVGLGLVTRSRQRSRA